MTEELVKKNACSLQIKMTEDSFNINLITKALYRIKDKIDHNIHKKTSTMNMTLKFSHTSCNLEGKCWRKNHARYRLEKFAAYVLLRF